MARGKRPCELGASCPYKHEYQHNLEFSHPNSFEASGVGATAKQKPFQGAARKLGGSVVRPLAPAGQAVRKKARPVARSAAAAAALGRAATQIPQLTTASTTPASSGSASVALSARSAQQTAHGSSRRKREPDTSPQGNRRAALDACSSDDVIDLTGFD